MVRPFSLQNIVFCSEKKKNLKKKIKDEPARKIKTNMQNNVRMFYFHKGRIVYKLWNSTK